MGLGLGPNLGKNKDLLDPSGLRRIPDFIKNRFIEVKNVGRLSLTRQINDLLHLLPNGQQLTLYVRGGTKLSGPLLDAIRKSGLIKVFRCLPG